MATIWYLEDDPHQQKALNQYLSIDHEVHALSTVDQLFKKINNLPKPEVILADLALRGSLNGFQVAEKLVTEHDISPQKFIFLTGWKREFSPLVPDIFKENKNIIMDKSNWTQEEIDGNIEKVLNGN